MRDPQSELLPLFNWFVVNGILISFDAGAAEDATDATAIWDVIWVPRGSTIKDMRMRYGTGSRNSHMQKHNRAPSTLEFDPPPTHFTLCRRESHTSSFASRI